MRPPLLHLGLVPPDSPRCDSPVLQSPLLLWMRTFSHNLLLTFLPLQQCRYRSPCALSLCVVLGTVLTLISHRPTPKISQLVPDGLSPFHIFIDGASFPTNPSTVSSALRAEHPAGLAPHTLPSTYNPLLTFGNTYPPQLFHSQLSPLDAPSWDGSATHLPRPVQTLPSNRICTNVQTIDGPEMPKHLFVRRSPARSWSFTPLCAHLAPITDHAPNSCSTFFVLSFFQKLVNGMSYQQQFMVRMRLCCTPFCKVY